MFSLQTLDGNSIIVFKVIEFIEVTPSCDLLDAEWSVYQLLAISEMNNLIVGLKLLPD